MLPSTVPTLDLSTRFLLALLSALAQNQAPPSAPPPYTSPPPNTSAFKLTAAPRASTYQDNDYDDSDLPPPSPPLRIHINASTTIQGNSNRIMLPSPSSTQESLTKLISVAVKDALPPCQTPTAASSFEQEGEEEGEVSEGMGQMIEVTLDAGTKIEGSGNVVVYRKGSAVNADEADGKGEEARKRRACSEPVDLQRVAHVKKLKN
ncbi:MAG: hypothetical protein Q9170_001751 [Blastenia crenularia]